MGEVLRATVRIPTSDSILYDEGKLRAWIAGRRGEQIGPETLVEVPEGDHLGILCLFALMQGHVQLGYSESDMHHARRVAEQHTREWLAAEAWHRYTSDPSHLGSGWVR